MFIWFFPIWPCWTRFRFVTYTFLCRKRSRGTLNCVLWIGVRLKPLLTAWSSSPRTATALLIGFNILFFLNLCLFTPLVIWNRKTLGEYRLVINVHWNLSDLALLDQVSWLNPVAKDKIWPFFLYPIPFEISIDKP